MARGTLRKVDRSRKAEGELAARAGSRTLPGVNGLGCGGLARNPSGTCALYALAPSASHGDSTMKQLEGE